MMYADQVIFIIGLYTISISWMFGKGGLVLFGMIGVICLAAAGVAHINHTPFY